MAIDQDISTKPLRADARRNRDAILQTAREVFELEGVLASLDGIALRAGVGNATLYRHFPTRMDLLAAVMAADLDDAQTVAKAAKATHAPRQALSEWLVWLTWRLRIWHDLPQCVADASAKPGSSISPAILRLTDITAELLGEAQAVGVARTSITPGEVFELTIAISWAIDRFGDDERSARRRVEVATTGLII